ncbi:beta strand repeat-containing protein [Paraburkholderia youngii]|nr:DUF4214 domain-containing protein [Paraburkholderia youngii]
MAAAQYYEEVQQAYLAYYGRPADPAGQEYWAMRLDNAGGNLSSIINEFGTSTESTALYGGSNMAAQITAIYQTLFGRAPDAEGLNFYQHGINSGEFTLASVALNIFYGATGTDKAQLDAKLAYADAFTNALSASVPAQIAYSGKTASDNARAAVAAVTDTTSEGTAVEKLDTTLANINAGAVGQTVALTAGVDPITLTGNNNVVTGTMTGAATDTFSALDKISGTGTGNVLNIVETATPAPAAMPAGISVSGVQTVNVVAAAGAYIDTTSGFTGLKTVNVTQSNGADNVKVGDGTAVNVADSDTTAADLVHVIATTGAVTVNAASDVTVAGGSTQTVTTSNGFVTATGATGNVTVTVADQDSTALAIVAGDTSNSGNHITVLGGANVSVTDTLTSATGGTAAESSGAIQVGSATAAPTGTVTIVQNLTDSANLGLAGGNITVTGGTTDSITVNATAGTFTAIPATDVSTTIGNVIVNGTSATTSVSVTETPAVVANSTAETAIAAVTGVHEVDTVTFSSTLANNAAVTIGGLTFTNTSGSTMTAAQVAAVFASLANGSIGGAGGPVTEGTFSGSLAAGWTSGAVVTGGTSASPTYTVAFTNSAAAAASSATLATGIVGATATLTTAGVQAVTGVAPVEGVTDGAVTITDVNFSTPTKAGTITNVALNGYGTAVIDSNALSTLSLANSTATVTVGNSVATTLGLTLNNVTGAAAVNLGTSYSSLSINATGANSAVALNAADVTALTVNGTKSVNLTGSTLTDVKTVAVSGSAGVTMNAAGTALTDFNASATSGANTVTGFNASTTTFEGGSGGDSLTLGAFAVTKAITFGSSNDTLVLGANAVSAAINGGAGTNTLSVDVVAAASESLSTTFATDVTNFQHLTLTGTTTAATTVNVAELGNYSYVTDSTNTTAGALTLSNFASGGTLVLTNTTAGDADIVTFANSTVNTNTLNLQLSSSGQSTTTGVHDTVTVSNAQSLNITSTDTYAKDAAGHLGHTVALVDGSTTASLTTLTITGNAALTLDTTGATAVTTVNASGDTGGLTYTTNGVVAETVTGGSGVNNLTAHAGSVADTLIGGSGINVLTSNSGLDTLTGGSGQNTFVINTPNSVNTYANITNAKAGDIVEFHNAATSFVGTQVQLASTAVFQDYANQAEVTASGGAASAAGGQVAWFQFGGNTYVVETGAGSTGTGFSNHVDTVVELQGLVNLSHASFNTSTGALVLH